MSDIRCNPMTREIEIIGSESFIEAHFHKIEALMIEGFGEKEEQASILTGMDKEPMLSSETKETIREAPRSADISITPSELPTTGPESGEAPQAPKVPRPPVRKYFNTLGKLIRSEDTSINKSQPVDVLGQTPEELSVASLREKFGLSERQIEEVIKDAEKQGRVRKDLDGSYVWV
ncbi:MAG: hypothetical protein FJ122_08090 [Deltaproteobacteria bacterium]|nr:hypothetical protein [Deltaproteobacteria bacterium]